MIEKIFMNVLIFFENLFIKICYPVKRWHLAKQEME